MADNIASDATYVEAFASWREQCKQIRPNDGLTLLTFLRSTHPNHHVTRTTNINADLLAYADAGHATAVFDTTNESYDVVRSLKVGSDDKLNKSKVFYNDVKFGRWQYEWNSKKFLIYQVALFEDQERPGVSALFILAPRNLTESQEGTHPDTEALLRAVADSNAKLDKEIWVYDDGFWKKDKSLYASVQKTSWDDVILDPVMKKTISDDISTFFSSQPLYDTLSVPWKRGLIFHGLPGNGKTTTIKAVINSLSARDEPIPALYVKSTRDGSGSKRHIRNIFVQARTCSPCVLIFEDLDSLVKEKCRSYFLNEVDGLESNEGILMIGSTNHLSKLDVSITKRPCRFDRKYAFKLPDENERALYSRFWMNKVNSSGIADFPEELCSIVAKLTGGFSFAYLKELFVSCLAALARDGTIHGEEVAADGSVKTSQVSENLTAGAWTKMDRDEIEIEISEALHDNLLLTLIHQQVRVLLEEMDSTDKVEESKSELARPTRAE
jgi:transitional endoplasmic reticulum ATPase